MSTKTIISFLNPYKIENKDYKIKEFDNKIVIFLSVLFVNLILSSILDLWSYNLPIKYTLPLKEINDYMDNTKPLNTLIIIGVMGPLIEECLFRYSVITTSKPTFYLMFFIIYLVTILSLFSISEDSIVTYIALIVFCTVNILFIGYILWKEKRIDKQLLQVKYFKNLIYLLSFLFAFLHFSNGSLWTTFNLYYGIFYLSIIFLFSIYLYKLRVYMGMKYCIALHIINNTLGVLVYYYM